MWSNAHLDRTTMLVYLLRLRSLVQEPAIILLGLFKRRHAGVTLIGKDVIRLIAMTVGADWLNNKQGWTRIREELQTDYQNGYQRYLEMKAVTAARQDMHRYGSRFLTIQEEQAAIVQFREKQKKDRATKAATDAAAAAAKKRAFLLAVFGSAEYNIFQAIDSFRVAMPEDGAVADMVARAVKMFLLWVKAGDAEQARDSAKLLRLFRDHLQEDRCGMIEFHYTTAMSALDALLEISECNSLIEEIHQNYEAAIAKRFGSIQ
jgi:hypothetical protein